MKSEDTFIFFHFPNAQEPDWFFNHLQPGSLEGQVANLIMSPVKNL